MPEPEYRRGAHARSRKFRRDRRLAELGYENYEAYIRSAAWQAVKRRYRASSLPQECVLCGATEPIVMHHKTYERVGEERLTDLMPMCPACHHHLHSLERDGHVTLDFAGPFDQERATAGRQFLEGLAQTRAADAQARHDEYRALLKSLPPAERLARAKRAARIRRVPIDGALFVFRAALARAKSNPDSPRLAAQAAKRLDRLEEIAHGWYTPPEMREAA